jgi:hypothetical protein
VPTSLCDCSSYGTTIARFENASGTRFKGEIIMGTWSLAGNALGNPPEGVFGTTDNNALVIETAGTERLRVDPSGNVGIGTANTPPEISLFAETFRVQSPNMWLSLMDNGGGQLRIANNTNDNRIWLEAYSADASSSATEMLLTGFAGDPVPQLTLNATNTTVTGTLTAGVVESPTINNILKSLEALNAEVSSLSAEISSLSAEVSTISHRKA